VAFQVRGVTLPDREWRTLVVDGDRLSTSPSAHADVVADGGWIVPGLVDVHTHPGTESTTDPFDEDLLRRQLVRQRDAGVLLVRTPGTAARIPDRVYDDADLPRVRSAGRWLATPGRFFPGYGREIDEADLVRAAVEEAMAAGGWCKVIGDWLPDDPPVPLDLLRLVVAEVHAAGGRVAVHCQTEQGCRNAVLAGVDSLEHGMHLDPALLDEMARQRIAVVPTLTAFASIEGHRWEPERGRIRDWLVSGWQGLRTMVTAAHEAGVTVLAGTDSLPYGDVAGEVDQLIGTGLPAEAALGAASWTARSWLGLPGLTDGAPADLVVYDADPTVDPSVLARPARIVLRGRVIR
jgi:imidazolonepropionase-like amidohydrolase